MDIMHKYGLTAIRFDHDTLQDGIVARKTWHKRAEWVCDFVQAFSDQICKRGTGAVKGGDAFSANEPAKDFGDDLQTDRPVLNGVFRSLVLCNVLQTLVAPAGHFDPAYDLLFAPKVVYVYDFAQGCVIGELTYEFAAEFAQNWLEEIGARWERVKVFERQHAWKERHPKRRK